MNRFRFVTSAMVVPFLLAGCGPGAQVRERAAHDFNCPEDRVKVKRVTGSASGRGSTGTYEANGCGRHGLYSTMCHPQVGCIVEAEANAAALSEAAAPRPAPAPAPTSEPRGEEVKAPEGLAGFTFGMPAEEAERACSDAGHEFEATKNGGRCSGTVASVGFDSEVLMAFCNDAVCHLRVTEPLDATLEAVTSRYTRMMELLEEKYGKPAKHEGDVPPRCEDVASCIEDGKLQLKTYWKVGGGYRVRIRIVPGPGLELDYRAPKEEPKGLAL